MTDERDSGRSQVRVDKLPSVPSKPMSEEELRRVNKDYFDFMARKVLKHEHPILGRILMPLWAPRLSKTMLDNYIKHVEELGKEARLNPEVFGLIDTDVRVTRKRIE